MKSKSAIILIIIGTLFIVFYSRLRYERKANLRAEWPVDTENSWEYPATRLAGNLFGWYERGLEMKEILRRANHSYTQVNYFLYLGILHITIGLSLTLIINQKHNKKLE